MATTITPRIVNINTIVTRAPQPSQLQQSAAIISLGGTTLTANTYQYIGSTGDLTTILSNAGNYVELTNMVSTYFAQGNAVGLYVLELGVQTTIPAGVNALNTWITSNPEVFYTFLTPATWDNSSAVIVGSATGTTLTVTSVTSGTVAVGQIVSGPGISTPIYIVSGAGSTWTLSASATVAGGSTITCTNYLSSVANSYESPNSKMYFFVSTTVGNVTTYADVKSVQAYVKSPTAVSTEFQAAAGLYNWVVNNPGASNPLAPMSYRYLYGVTPWPQTSANYANINTVLTTFGNLVLTGAEGGISNACLFKGTTMDGQQASWWYGIDWIQIQVKQALAAAIINGSNQNPPLLYNQAGINTLQQIAQNIANSAVAFGCALSAVVDAIPFTTYTQQNPTHYNAGIYNGLSMTAVGQNGFLTISFTLDAVQFA